MQVDRKLNLVVPIQRPEGPIYVHSTPISREVFERHFLVMSKTFAALWDQGLHITVGPRVAGLMLKQQAERLGIWEGPEGVEAGLMAEIRRLSNVAMPGASGWTLVPFQLAIDKGQIDPDEAAEVEGELVFFTLECSLRKRAQLPVFVRAMNDRWGSLSTSLSATEYAASLPISTKEESSGETVKPSSIPA